MDVSKHILQSIFKNEYQKLLIQILVTNNHLVNSLKSLLKKYNLTPQQYNVLRILRGANQEISIQQLKERLIEKNSDVSRIVIRLLQKNLIQKIGSKQDKRLTEVILTKTGYDLVSKIDIEDTNFFNLLQPLTNEECGIAAQLLAKIGEKKTL